MVEDLRSGSENRDADGGAWEAEAWEVGGVESWQSDVTKLLFLFLFCFA